MKKIGLTSLALLGTLGLFAQSGKIQWGLSLSSTHNESHFIGGNGNAHARFHHNEFKGVEWQISARKDLNNHLFIQTGIGANVLGFSTVLTQNYSLLNKDYHYKGVTHKWLEGIIPLMGFYKSNLNCKNWRWVAGGGVSLAWHNNLKTFKNNKDQIDDSANKSFATLMQTTNARKYTRVNGLLSIGMEKQFKKNQLFGVYLFGSFSGNNIANSFVEYTLDNQNYMHQFTNKGSYWGLRFSYFFRTKSQ
jgi:hypothetical protein